MLANDAPQFDLETTSQARQIIPMWAALWLVALMALTVSVRLASPTGWLGSDDVSYYCAAEHILTGETIQRAHHHYARLAVIAPVALSMALFGENPAAIALPSCIASLLCVLLIAVLGRCVWDWWEGLCAATIISVLPYYRVLSTTGYPETQACLWSVGAVLIALMIVRSQSPKRILILSLTCGLVVGLAASAKEFSIYTFVAVAAIIVAHQKVSWFARLRTVTICGIGIVIYFFGECVFYLWAADDFWFHIHALGNTNAIDWAYPPTGFHEAATLSGLIWKRLTIVMLESTTFGWGMISVVFWPAVLIVVAINRRGRWVGIWALAAYLLLAFLPVNFRNGPQPYPVFEGRNDLLACIPFALCLAWSVRRGMAMLLNPVIIRRSWPAVMAIIVMLAYANPHELSGFRNRETQRVARAVEQIATFIQSQPNEHGYKIFMPPSLYRRHRILFPAELRPRLRVAVSNQSPSWWQQATVDIASRAEPLPSPSQAYLIATPLQWQGQPESWDYGVHLPEKEMQPWLLQTPLATAQRSNNHTISLTTNRAELVASKAGGSKETILVLRGPNVSIKPQTLAATVSAQDSITHSPH